MDTQQDLIGEIEAFCRYAGIAETTFGRQVVNDGKFVARLRDGKGVTTRTVARVRRYLSESAPPRQGDHATAARLGQAGPLERAGPSPPAESGCAI